ncbi:MAG TPA: 16S rRNA (guanine(527)-N(7))-methyltransferase RsmG [Rhodospirillaceae bacterium]|nr:16S rRNA (guanine(527)-N(7))-methyltransferase RsmG [Rhodospirillaceae bacterium]
MQKLDRYAALLTEWNEKFNLVATSTIPLLWERHFLDSAQLFPLIPTPATTRLIDLGSGAGFPALVLAILGVGEVHCLESTGKKARFLEEVAKELGLPVTVHAERIEAVKGLKGNVITARALTALPDLLKLSKPFMEKESFCLFLKGEKADAELTDCRKYWTFRATKTRSSTSQNGVILHISDIERTAFHEFKHPHRSKRP